MNRSMSRTALWTRISARTLLLPTWDAGVASIMARVSMALASRTSILRLGTASRTRIGTVLVKNSSPLSLTISIGVPVSVLLAPSRKQRQLLPVFLGRMCRSPPRGSLNLATLRRSAVAALIFSRSVSRVRETQSLRS